MPELINPGPIEFDAVIEREEAVSNSSAWVYFPFDLKATYGKGNLVPVRATFDDKVHYQGSLAKMNVRPALVVRVDVREQLGKKPGDRVHVKIELDDRPRVVEVSPEFRGLLQKHPAAEAYWSKLAFSHQREYWNWISEAKKVETRDRRMAKAIEMLSAGKKEAR